MTEHTEIVSCFSCGGAGEIGALVRLDTDHCEPRLLRCDTCDGTGRVSVALLAQWQESRRRRELRKAAGFSGREMAQRLGMNPLAYSRCEWARDPWPEGSKAVFAALAGSSALEALVDDGDTEGNTDA